MSAPQGLWTAEAAKAADAHAIDTLGIASPVLIERAALAVAASVQRIRDGRSVVCVAGPGHNGADAYAVARILRGWGVDACAWSVTTQRSEAAQQQLDWARAYGVPILEGSTDGAFPSEALWVDGLLGTGSHGAPRGAVAAALRRMRDHAGPCVAIDVPSGVNVDTGDVHLDACQAACTVTFVRAKPGLLVTPGRSHVGKLVVADIGIPGTHVPEYGQMLGIEALGKLLAMRPRAAHKGVRGHVGVVGGAFGMRGAAVLCATAAMRAGAGLCTWETEQPEAAALRPELMVQTPCDPPLPRATVLAVGPGWRPVRARAEALYRGDPRPAVWDASGLSFVQGGVEVAGPRVLTPHPKEAAALLQRLSCGELWTADKVQANRLEVASRLHAATGATVVLKGEGSVVVGHHGLQVVLEGSDALATAGTGDVLTGAVAALLAAGFCAQDAAALGASWHGRAGDVAALRTGTPLALDVAEALPEAASQLAQGIAGPREPVLVHS